MQNNEMSKKEYLYIIKLNRRSYKCMNDDGALTGGSGVVRC